MYGRRPSEDAICSGMIKTNKGTYGPFTAGGHNDAVFAASPHCGSNYVVDVPQDRSFESWFSSAYTTVVEDSVTHLGRFAGDQFYNAALLGTFFCLKGSTNFLQM